MTNCRCRTVERNGDVFGRVLLQDSLEHERKSIDGIRRQSLTVREVANREMRSIRLGHSVEDKKEWMFYLFHRVFYPDNACGQMYTFCGLAWLLTSFDFVREQ
jgi:hypothetical protein